MTSTGFVRKTLSILGADVGIHAATLFLRLYVAATFGAHQFGIFSLLVLIPEYCVKLGRFGIDDASIYWSGKGKYTFAEVSATMLILITMFSLIALGIVAFGNEAFNKYLLKNALHPDEGNVMVLVALTIPFYFLIQASAKVFVFLERITAYNIVTFLPPLVGLLSGLLFSYSIGGNISVFVAGYLLSFVVFGILAVMLVLSTVRLEKPFTFSIAQDLISYGMKLYVPNMLQYLHYRIDMLILGYFTAPQHVAYYVLAVNLAEILRKIPNSVSALFFPRVSRLSGVEALLFTAKNSRHIAILVFLLSVPLYLITKFFVIPSIGNEFQIVLIPFIVLIPGIIAVSVIQILMLHYYGQGEPKLILRSIGIGLVLNVGLNLALIPVWKSVGASIASSISYLIVAFLLLADVRKSSEDGVFREFYRIQLSDWRIYKEALLSRFVKQGVVS
jgi:O-antigen/teichoic acid export membrane protein